MSGISLTASMRSNLLSLQNIASQQDIVQNRLATGLKVSSAIDNPSSYYTASSLNNRAADLTALLDAMSQGIQTIKAASEAIESGTKFLEQAKAVANQALETAQNVIARVSTEAELLAAIDSGRKGLIIAEGTITLSDNTSLYLKDGQSLVGAKYLDKNAAETTINFKFDGIIDNGIEAGNCSIISDLNINFITDNRSIFRNEQEEKSVISIKSKQTVKLRNLHINTDTSADDKRVGLFTIEATSSSVDISGNINISIKGKYTRGIYADKQSNMAINNAHINNKSDDIQSYLLLSYGGSVININGNSEINLMGLETLLRLNNSGRINFNDDSILNVYGTGDATSSIISINGAVITFRDKSSLNVRNQGAGYAHCLMGNLILENQASAFFSGNGFINEGKIFINSASAKINIDTAILYRGTNNYISAVSGASFSTSNGTYTALTSINNLLINDANLSAYFKLDNQHKTAIPPETESMFADFDNHMSQNQKEDETEKTLSAGEYQKILEQYDMLISDASYKGLNLLEGQYLKINFNEDRSSKINVPGVKAGSGSLGLKTKEWKTAEDIEKSVSELENAINSLRGFASEFGNYYSIVTTRQDFTENLINVLEEGADKLTLADMNQESANMLALQTSQQLAVNSLSLASRASQAILRLF